MRTTAAWVGAGALAVGMVIGGVTVHVAKAQPVAVQTCGSAAPQLRTTLYLGGARPKGSVSELEWQLFLRDKVTTRFPNGMTVWDAEGQWREQGGKIGHERTKVLLLVHPDTEAALQAIRAVIDRYRKHLNRNRCFGKRRTCAPCCDALGASSVLPTLTWPSRPDAAPATTKSPR